MTDAILPRFAATLRGGQPVFAAWIETPAQASIEALLGAGFDTAVLDMQHGGFDMARATDGIAACALGGKPAIARIPVGDFATASRLLDAGAAAIVAPMIETVEQAKALVGFTKYPPLGERSWGPGRAKAFSGLGGSDYLNAANGLHLTLAMIETRAALAGLDGILAVEGIDGVFVGPSDLSIGLSRGAGVDPASSEVDAALSRVASQARAAGKIAGLFCFSGAQAKAMAARGFGLMTIATDLLLLQRGARVELDATR